MNLKFRVDGRGEYEDETLQKILESREIRCSEHFLNPTSDDLYSPLELKNLDEAADIVWNGIENGSRFFVNLDSDLDGVCSGTIIYKWIKAHLEDKRNIGWAINQGKTHGMNNHQVREIIDFMPDIVIIVDSLDGTTEYYDQIKEETGAQIVVLDHHLVDPAQDYGRFITLVSSQVDYPNKDLCGSGVVFKFVEYLNMFDEEPFDDSFIELAAAGTVGDMMNLDEEHMENRYFVHKAIQTGRASNPIIKSIIGGYELDSRSFSFSVAPLVNAANRLHENDFVAECFLFDESATQNKERIKKLQKLKTRQKKIVDEQVADVIEQVANIKTRNFLFAIIDEDCSEFSGLIANKILEMYKMPVLILKEGMFGYSGSGRADGYESFIALCLETGLADCGGHENAFGVKCIRYEDFESFCEKLDDILDRTEHAVKEFDADCVVYPEDITGYLIDQTKKIDRISGLGFPPISYMIELDEYEVTTMSQGKHLVFEIPDLDFACIKWNAGDQEDFYSECAMNGDPIALIGTLANGRMGKYNRRMIVDRIEVGEYTD